MSHFIIDYAIRLEKDRLIEQKGGLLSTLERIDDAAEKIADLSEALKRVDEENDDQMGGLNH
ncbi:MAG: hypothetical protein GY782_03980 [Gammaproteobacteria bacterium]|nr:hypothetical protein [Gammaproteobacteria bacterium]